MASLGKRRSKLGEVPSFLCSCQLALSWGYSLASGCRGGTSQEKREGRRRICRQEQKFLKLSELLLLISVVDLHGKGDPFRGLGAGLACEHWMDTPGTNRRSKRSRQWQVSFDVSISRLPCGGRLQKEGVAWKVQGRRSSWQRPSPKSWLCFPPLALSITQEAGAAVITF